MLLSIESFCGCILCCLSILILVVIPFDYICVIPSICIFSITTSIIIPLTAIMACCAIISAFLVTIFIFVSIILALYLEFIAFFCCGQIPYIPFDIFRDWNFAIILSLFPDRINFLISSYLNIFKDFLEKYLK